jgi:hypothetical protein
VEINNIDMQIEELLPRYRAVTKLFDEQNYQPGAPGYVIGDGSIADQFHALREQLDFLYTQKHKTELTATGFKLRGEFIHE